jgi:hypothetical protein
MVQFAPRDFREWMRMVERQIAQARSSGNAALIEQLNRQRSELKDDIADAGGDLRTPARVVEVIYQTALVRDNNNRWTATLTADFPAVIYATDGTPLTVEFYELWGLDLTNQPEFEEDLWKQVSTSALSRFVVPRFEQGSQWVFRIRAIGTTAVYPGLWSTETSVRMEKDTTPPPIPSRPKVSVLYGVIHVEWDGKGAAGESMPADFSHIEIAWGLSAAPELLSGRRLSTAASTSFAGVPYFETRYFRFRSVDLSGNFSSWSASASGTPMPLVNTDEIDATLEERLQEEAAAVQAAGGATAAAHVSYETKQQVAAAAAAEYERLQAVADAQRAEYTSVQQLADHAFRVLLAYLQGPPPPTVELHGAGRLRLSDAQITFARPLDLSGVGYLSYGPKDHADSVTLSGAGSLARLAAPQFAGALALAGSGTLSTVGGAGGSLLDLTGSGALFLLGGARGSALEFTGSGDLTATGVAGGTGGPVTVEDIATGFIENTGTTVTVTGVTIVGEDRHLIVLVGFNNDNLQTISSVVLDPGGLNLSLTSLGTAIEQDDSYVAVYSLEDPPLGTFMVRAVISASLEVATATPGHLMGVAVWSLSNVSAVRAVGTAHVDGTTLTVTAATAVNDVVLYAAYQEDNIVDGSNFTLTNQTPLESFNIGTRDTFMGGRIIADSSSETFTFTTNTNGNMKKAAVAVSLSPSAVSGAPQPVSNVVAVVVDSNRIRVSGTHPGGAGVDYVVREIAYDPLNPSEWIVPTPERTSATLVINRTYHYGIAARAGGVVSAFTFAEPVYLGTSTEEPPPPPPDTDPPVGDFPGFNAVGHRQAPLETISGSLTITSPAVYERVRFTGTVAVDGVPRVNGKAQVIFRDCVFERGGSGDNVRTRNDGHMALEYCTVIGGANGIAYSRYHAFRCNIYGQAQDGVKLGDDTLLEESWIHDLNPEAGAHADGGQMQSAAENLIVRNCHIDSRGNGSLGNAALIIKNDSKTSLSGPGPVLIENNFLDGGNYTVFIRVGSSGGTVDNITVRNNVLGGNFRYGYASTNTPFTGYGNTDTSGNPISALNNR